MELREFVKTTLVEVFQGVMEAQAAVEKGRIAPQLRPDPKCANWGVIREFEFDVSLAAGDETSQKGGIGVLLGAVGLGGQSQLTMQETSHTRVKFSVPVVFPEPPDTTG